MKTNDEERLRRRLSIAQLDRDEAMRAGQDLLTCLVIIERFDLSDYLTCLRDMLSTLEVLEKKAWLGNLTKTLFLFGSPRKLADTYDFKARSGGMAVTLIRHTETYNPVVQLLTPMDTKPMSVNQRDALLSRVCPSAHYRIELDPTSSVLTDILVHLNHIIAEAVLGHILPISNVLLTDIMFKSSMDPAESLYTRVVPEGSSDTLKTTGALFALSR